MRYLQKCYKNTLAQARDVHGDEGARAAEASFAVHGYQAGVGLGKFEKLTNDLLGGDAAIDEVPKGEVSQFFAAGSGQHTYISTCLKPLSVN